MVTRQAQYSTNEGVLRTQPGTAETRTRPRAIRVLEVGSTTRPLPLLLYVYACHFREDFYIIGEGALNQ